VVRHSTIKLILLDRDGVINEDSPDYIKSSQEWRPIQGSLTAIAKLNKANFKVAIISNQSGLARGYFDQEALDAIHNRLSLELAEVGGRIDKIYYCPHHPQEGCSCRKPQPGLLQQAFADFDVEPIQTILIGDSYSDLQAAANAGCYSVLVKTGNGLKTLLGNPKMDVPTYPNLSSAVQNLIFS
jgi:D-glycero-D-manno-heptose 1,7-bisphosphate phosphatase